MVQCGRKADEEWPRLVTMLDGQGEEPGGAATAGLGRAESGARRDRDRRLHELKDAAVRTGTPPAGR